jgi:hypothetical protein
MGVPGYNSPQRMTFSKRLLAWIIALLSIASAHALNSWDSPSADLAARIAALTGPGTITLSVTNRTTLSTDDVAAIRLAVERELRKAGVIVRTKDADSDARITLSQNLQGWLWVAEVQQGSETKVEMLPVVGSSSSASPMAGSAITLHSSLILSQADPILDVALLGAGNEQHLFVLEPAHIEAYTAGAGSWQLAKSYDIAQDHPYPRDMRGRIAAGTDHLFDVYLPGVACSATRISQSWELTVACNDSDDPWPLAAQKAFYNSTRNFFTGVLVPGFGPKLPPFYSATEISRAGSTAFLFVDVGGGAHILENNSHKLLIGARDWGSDIVAVHSECGQGMQVLTSAAGWPASDSIRAYEIAGREATPVTAPLSFDGIITAVWPGNDRSSATVVVQKPQGRRYEAYSVSLACSR